ncbi:MAG: MdtA/MuxA family multidrug efflux RND transporter periplasmic adaptor subunit [Methylobacter sp.]|uniref:MdtA/MuxA family multidrug efflux RND transporter periplasmic adaptor subunit n=1 Tax=Methylobacter sp. TaxID=2051955 RepID=UPI00258897D6|nr:MdtA/MuxA family multidrug efflux RND transporter periplasmic adaptor subunit [Methylobacter sp.]MCL7422992.1 MdtA/MuxA family multidrug efflux RND transporter periplasmic adaptor subunit [Methylobacter sp.]
MKLEENKASRPAKPKRRYHWLAWPVLILLISTAYFIKPFIGGFVQAAPEKKRSDSYGAGIVAAIVAEPVKEGDVPVYLNGLGTVTGLRTVTVKSRVDGELVHIAFKEGGVVREGDQLAEIDPRPFQVQLMQAEGQLLRDEALLRNARIDLERYQTLLEQDSIAAQQVATQEATVEQYQGIVATDQALVANAKLQLSYAKISAPIAGRLGLRMVDQGNIVKASDANGIAVITQTQPIAVVFTVPEDQVPAVMKRLHSGKVLPVEAYDRSGKNKLAQGRLMAVDNRIDPATGTVKLKSQFNNEDESLFANQFVNIRMKIDTLRGVAIAPSAAIQNGNAGSFVYVVKDGQTVSTRPVKLGPVDGEQVAVLEGLQADEQVVVDGADKLREGARVKVIGRSGTVAGGALLFANESDQDRTVRGNAQ